MRINKRKDNRGFTLMEVLIAVVIIAAALVTLFGLQSASLSQTRDNSNQIQAVAITRTIFSLLEQNKENQNITQSGDAASVISQLSSGGLQIDKEEFSRFDVELTSNFAPFPGLDENAIKKITLLVKWGDRAGQSMTTDYFVSGLESEADDE